MGDEPDGPVPRLAHRLRLRALLRLHRRRDQPVRARHLPGHRADRAGAHRRGGLPLHGGHDRSRHLLDPPAEGARAGQALLRLLRPGRDARPAPRADGVVRPLQGRVRRRLGRTARADSAAPDRARRGARGRRADGAAARDPGLGRDARRPQAGAGAPDGGLRRLPGAHRPPRRTPGRRAGRPRRPRRHADLRDHRRQRRVRRGHAARHVQRAHGPERRGAVRDHGVHGLAHRGLRHAGGLQPLRRRLGARHGHAVPVDEAGRLALGRHAQRHHRPLATRLRGAGRDPQPVPPRHRRRADDPGGGRAAASDARQRHPAAPAGGREHGVHVRRRRRGRPPRHAVLRDVLQPGHLPPRVDGLHAPLGALGHVGGDADLRPRIAGSCTRPTTGRRRATSPPSSRTAWPSCSSSS